MRRYLLAFMLAALPLGGALASGDALQECDAREPGASYGTIEVVEQGSNAWSEPVDHSRHARVRLDDGRTVTVLIGPLQHIEPGQRVRIVPGSNGAHAVQA
jgi:hypothetical protein